MYGVSSGTSCEATQPDQSRLCACDGGGITSSGVSTTYDMLDGDIRCYCSDNPNRPACAGSRGGGTCFDMPGGEDCAPQGRGYWGSDCPTGPEVQDQCLSTQLGCAVYDDGLACDDDEP